MAKKAKPVKSAPLETNTAWLEKIAGFVKSNQLLLTIILAVALLGVLGGTVYSQMKRNEADEANKIFDIAMSEVQMMINSEDEAQRQQLFQDHLTQLESLIQTYPKTIAAVRARLYMGKIYFSEAYQSGNIDAIGMALQYYSDAKDYAKNNFFRALGAIGMAYCYEQQNNYIQAAASFQEVLDNYPDEGFNPLCLVGLARSKEMVSDINGAITYYNKVISGYPESYWTRFARGKIYFYSSGTGTAVQPSVPSFPLQGGPALP